MLQVDAGRCCDEIFVPTEECCSKLVSLMAPTPPLQVMMEKQLKPNSVRLEDHNDDGDGDGVATTGI